MPTSDTDNAAHLNGAAYAAYITAPLGDEVWGDDGMDDRHNGANHAAAADGASEPVEPVPSRAERRRRQRAEGGFDRAEDPPKELSDFDRAVLIQRFVDQNVIENSDNFWTETSNARLQKLGPFPRVAGDTLVIKIRRPDGTHSYQLRPHVPRGTAKYVGMKGSGGDVHVAAASVDDIDDPRVPMAFTESPIKTEALARAWSCGTKLCAIGCFGVY
jgi:hypothetical protein